VNLVAVNNMTDNKNQKTLGELFKNTDFQIPTDKLALIITGLANDSRRVKPGDLFFAVAGFAVDGRKFVPEAVSMGAVAVVSETPIEGLTGIPQVICRDIRRTMSLVAARFYDDPSKNIPVIGVTGTNGKTTTTYMLAHIMASRGKKWGRFGTIEYDTGKRIVAALNTTPDSLELQAMLAEVKRNGLGGCVMEVSSHGLDLGRVDNIEFSGAIYTNLTQDHLDYHKDMESYFKAKRILFDKLLKRDGFAVLNALDPYSRRLQDAFPGRVIYYAAVGNSDNVLKSDLVVRDLGYNNNRRHYEASYRGLSIRSSLPYMGKFNLMNAAGALAGALGMGLTLAEAAEALATGPQVPGRVQKIDCGQPFDVIVDYAHTPDAIKNLLEGVDTSGYKIIVFGCGGDRDKTKRPIMGDIASRLADRVIVTTDNPRTEIPEKIISDIVAGVANKDKLKVIENRDEAIGVALGMAGAGDLVIIAGKGHENYQIVGKTKTYFSDQDVIRKYLKKMGYAAS